VGVPYYSKTPRWKGMALVEGAADGKHRCMGGIDRLVPVHAGQVEFGIADKRLEGAGDSIETHMAMDRIGA
jgi:hypothetical protein